MKHLSPPSPEVRAILKMAGIAGIIIGVQGLLHLLTNWFTGDQIVMGLAACLLAGALYMVFQMLADQERHKDALRKLGQQ